MMGINSNKRLRFFSPHDMSLGFYRERCLELISQDDWNIATMDDAIELYELFEMVEACPFIFDEEENDYSFYLDRAKCAKSEACKHIGQSLANTDLLDLIENVDTQSSYGFWKLFAAANCSNIVSRDAIKRVLDEHPDYLKNMLAFEGVAKTYSDVLLTCIYDNPAISAPMIISELAVDRDGERPLFLPGSLEADRVDEVMLAYLASGHPNLNYVAVLVKWPSQTRGGINYVPSDEVRVAAVRMYKQWGDSHSTTNVTSVRYGVSVTFDGTGDAPTLVSEDCSGNGTTQITYDAAWLREYYDAATILNNMIYIFELVDDMGLLTMVAHDNDESSLQKSLGLHALQEYQTSISFNIRDMCLLSGLRGYQELLASVDARLEDAISWFFNEYIEEEFGVSGFSISMPDESDSLMSKCKSIGPEIERALKLFSLYCERGSIEQDYYERKEFSGFFDIESLNANKYIYGVGDGYAKASRLLFSDQSFLAYPDRFAHEDRNFAELISQENISMSDYADWNHGNLNWLLDEGFISLSSAGSFELTENSYVLATIWREGGCPSRYISPNVLDCLLDNGYVECKSSLFTKDESAYLSYIFHNRDFSNALALRNNYGHGSYNAERDDQELETDYIRFMVVMLCVVLKINEDLCLYTGKGGIFGDSVVDW